MSWSTAWAVFGGDCEDLSLMNLRRRSRTVWCLGVCLASDLGNMLSYALCLADIDLGFTAGILAYLPRTSAWTFVSIKWVRKFEVWENFFSGGFSTWGRRIKNDKLRSGRFFGSKYLVSCYCMNPEAAVTSFWTLCCQAKCSSEKLREAINMD